MTTVQYFAADIVVWGAAVLCASIGLLLSGLNRDRIARPCVISLGVIPFPIYLTLHFLFPSPSSLSQFDQIAIMSLFIAPNYFVSFLLVAGYLLRFRHGAFAKLLKARGLCLWLLAVHLLGLGWEMALTFKS